MVKEFTRQYLLISLFPVVLLFVFTIAGRFIAQRHLSELIADSTHELNADAKKELESLGQQIIQEKARDVARQVGLFLSLRPEMDMDGLQRSAQFQAIAMQLVGQNGYVCLYEAGTGIMRIHPNPDLTNRKMDFLSTDIPSWWAIFHSSLSARNGDEAISLYRKNPDDINLVVLDLIMPGASGSDTFDMLRQINTGVKVLLASGYSIDSQAIALMDRGCDGFIQKPYNLEALSRKIDEILKSEPS